MIIPKYYEVESLNWNEIRLTEPCHGQPIQVCDLSDYPHSIIRLVLDTNRI